MFCQVPPQRRNLIGTLLLLLLVASLVSARAQTVILHLKNGDRIACTIISEDTNRVVITNSWIKELTVPLAEIVSREKLPPPAAPAQPAEVKPAPPPAEAKATAPPAETKTTPRPETKVATVPTNAPPRAGSSLTNVMPSASPGTPIAIASPPPPKQKTPGPKYWKGEARVGADFLFGAKDQQIFYGRFKLIYEHPYKANAKKFFRNILDYSVDYGRTKTANSSSDAVISANKMDVNDKTDFDFGARKLYVYNLMGVGYDKLRKIDLHYEIGPGLGYHLLGRTNLVMNTELGFNYQVQDRSDSSSTKKFYFRFGEDVTWKINKTFTFTEKAEFFPQVERIGEYRARAEATFSYGFWQNLSLNLSLLDLYDTQPASNVPNNDIQIRSSLGITF